MGRAERARWQNNDRAVELVSESRRRSLSIEEIDEVKRGYTGYGGLTASNGQFFTPSAITEFVVNLLGFREGEVAEVLEPSCGAGAFFNVIPRSYRTTGVEMMNEASAVARLCYPHVTVLQENTLEILPLLQGRFDYVVGNPPFMSMKNRPELIGFEVARFLGKAEWYFIELAFHALKPGGICAFVVPDGILANSKDKPGRKWLLDSAWVRGVISLPTETFYHVGTSVKTSVLIFQKRIPGVELNDYSVFMAMADNIGWDSRGRTTGKNDLPQILEEWLKFRGYQEEALPSLEPQVASASLPEPEPERQQEPQPEPFYAIPIVRKAKSRKGPESMNMGFDFGG